MKILHLNSYFSTSPLFNQLYRRQEEAGLNIDVFVPVAKEYPEDKLASQGDYTKVVPSFHQWQRWIFPLKHYPILKDLKKAYHIPSFDLIHAHSLFSNGWLTMKLYQEYKLPYLVAVRSADIETFFGKMPWMRSLGLKIMDQAQEIIFISASHYQRVFDQYIPAHLQDRLKAKSRIIANGIDDYWHQERLVQKDQGLHHPIRLVYAGKIMKRKRLVELCHKIDAYIKDRQVDLELNLVGPEWEEGLLKKLQAYPFVTYHGPMAKEELKDFYRQMDIFIMLSYPETFGLVYAEAMSQGLPLIYTKGEGFDGFFKDKTVGVSIDRYSQTDFNQGLDYVLNHYHQMAQAALTNIHFFKWNDINQENIDLYQKLINSFYGGLSND